MNYRPLITEPGSSVVYPKPFERIPLFREAYFTSPRPQAHTALRVMCWCGGPRIHSPNGWSYSRR
jgi:hypothetical protein